VLYLLLLWLLQELQKPKLQLQQTKQNKAALPWSALMGQGASGARAKRHNHLKRQT